MNTKYYFFLLTLSLASTAEAGFVHRDASTLIVGGRPALQGEAPYQLSIRLFGDHLCGASLVEINGTQVGVTAAHCIPYVNYPYILVAGDLNKTDVTGIEQFRPVSKSVIHQNYSYFTLENDIALHFFDQSFQLNKNVSTIPLPKQGQVTSQGNLKVSGWGRLQYKGESPDLLQIVDIPLVNDTECQKAYQDYPLNVDDNMICAGSMTSDINPCHGDSGGPGISDAGYLAGIVSWAHECGRHSKYPAVFTKVANYVDWIHARVREYQKGKMN